LNRAGESTPTTRAALVAGEEAARAPHAAVGDDVLVGVAGEQADLGRRVARGQLLVRRRTDLRVDIGLSVSSSPSVAMVSVMTSFS
jgi:hypothetical protein